MNLADTYCPRCKGQLDNIHGTDPTAVIPETGDGFMCPCGFVGVFTDEGVREFTEEETNALTEQEKNDMDFARRVLKIPSNGSE